MDRSVIIYGRVRCHLCDEMWEDLQPLLRQCAHRLQVIDVDSDPQLRARYGLRVPVLVVDGEEVCAGRLDVAHALRHLGIASA